METIFDGVSAKPEIDDVFEESLGNNIFEDIKNHQLLENERIEAMLKSISHNAAVPNLHPNVVFYTPAQPTTTATPAGEPSLAKVTHVFLFPKKEDKKESMRSIEEIMKDVFDEECFCDYFEPEGWEIPTVETLMPKPVKKLGIDQTALFVTQAVPSPAPATATAEPKPSIWKVYVIDNAKKLGKAIKAFFDFNIHWEFNFPREYVATSAYAALCIFVSIPFGIVAAEKLDLPFNNYLGIESRVQETVQVQPQEQPKIEVQVGDQVVQLPNVPQPEQNVQQPVAQPQPKPQNLQIVTPGTGEAANYYNYTPQTQPEYEQQPVYPNTETYEPVYNYAYTETAWVEPVSEPQPKIENTATTEYIPEAAPATQAIPANNEVPPKVEPVAPVAPPVAEPVQQSRPFMPEPLPSSDAFMRPQASK